MPKIIDIQQQERISLSHKYKKDYKPVLKRTLAKSIGVSYKEQDKLRAKYLESALLSLEVLDDDKEKKGSRATR